MVVILPKETFFLLLLKVKAFSKMSTKSNSCQRMLFLFVCISTWNYFSFPVATSTHTSFWKTSRVNKNSRSFVTNMTDRQDQMSRIIRTHFRENVWWNFRVHSGKCRYVCDMRLLQQFFLRLFFIKIFWQIARSNQGHRDLWLPLLLWRTP